MIWPEHARYCVHVFEANPTGLPVPKARIFSATLKTYNSVNLRRSGARGWWTFDAGLWWAKAHNRQFDCESKWPIEGERIDATAAIQ
jgi:hypothetical protein